MTIAILLGFLFPGHLLAQEQNGIISGTLTDIQTGTPLASANISVLDTRIGTVSNQDGKFEIANVPFGQYVLEVSYSFSEFFICFVIYLVFLSFTLFLDGFPAFS